ncbi:MAG: hypothetical protein ACOCTT_01175 [archaeon]
MAYEDIKKIAPHVIAIILLVLILLITMIKFGYMRCDTVPGMCGVYYGIFGEPKIAIIEGEGAIGNPQLLQEAIIQEKGMFPVIIPIGNVQTAGMLEQYDVVIVEGPKEISTNSMRAFARYVQQGGKLIWVGDAGTELGKYDYICRGNPSQDRPIEIHYKRKITMEEGNETFEQCGDWETITSGTGGELDNPTDLKAGLCGKDYSEIVMEFIRIDHSIQEEMDLCEDNGEKAYEVRNADGITNCIEEVEAQLPPEEDMTSMSEEEMKEEINEVCGTRANPWKRGPSETPGEEILPGIDFSYKVLGVDYMQKGDPEVENLFLNPVSGDHMLASGFVHDEIYFGEADFSRVTHTRIPRNEVIFTLSKGEAEESHPAVVTFQPTGVIGPGNVVYYAFPPEIGYRPEVDRGKMIVYNMMRYIVPL